jgi:Concanavalin A-like lectin/glucanases superfamily
MVLLVALGMFLCVLWIDMAFAQLSARPTIEITSPSQGQQVPVGELTISGTSADNATTNCQVDVDWNDQKPYQKTLATGPSGVNDYSNWTFTYTRDYHLITNGTNDLTARLSCTDNSIPVAWDTADVLGTSTTTTTTSTSNVGCISNDDQIGISKLVNATNISNATTTRVTLPSLVYNFEQSPNLSGSDCIDIANNSSLQLTMFSIASWFNTQMDVSNGSNSFIVTKGGVGSDSEGKNMNYGIWMIDSENIQTGFENSTGANYFVMSPSNYSDGNWHYVVGTYDGSQVKLYVDGVQVASNLTTTPPRTIPDNTGIQPVRIGANSLELVDGKGDGYFTGRIGEIRLWNRSLSAEEVSAAYNNGLFNTTGQVLYLPFSSQNHPPITDAGPDLTVNEKQVILLNNSKGSDSDPEDTLTYKWTQIGGSPLIRLSNNNTGIPIFNAPLDIPADTTFTLQFSVTDNHGLNDNDTMNVLVKNIPSPPSPTSPPELDDEAAASADEAVVVTVALQEDAKEELKKQYHSLQNFLLPFSDSKIDGFPYL